MAIKWHFIKDNDLPPVDKNFSKTYYLAYKSDKGRSYVDLAQWTWKSSEQKCVWIYAEHGVINGLRVEPTFKAYAWAEIDWPKPPKE